jgi:hypothetical protein
LTYKIRFDNETGMYQAESRLSPLICGRGKSLSAAIDALERSLEYEPQTDKINVNLIFQEMGLAQ